MGASRFAGQGVMLGETSLKHSFRSRWKILMEQSCTKIVFVGILVAA